MTKLQQHQITDTMRFDVFFGALMTEVAGQELSPLQLAIRTAMSGAVPASLEGVRATIDAVLLEHQPAGLPVIEPAPGVVIATIGQLAELVKTFGPADASDIESTAGKQITISMIDGGIRASETDHPGAGNIELYDQPADAPQEPVSQDAAWPFPSGNRGQVH